MVISLGNSIEPMGPDVVFPSKYQLMQIDDGKLLVNENRELEPTTHHQKSTTYELVLHPIPNVPK